MNLPAGYISKQSGYYFNPTGEGTKPYFVCRKFVIVAQTRNDLGNAWGLWLRWHDDDDRQHNWAMPKAMLSGDGREIRSYLLDGGFKIATSKNGREKFIDLLADTDVKERARAVDKVGWTGGVFALTDRTIGDTVENRVIFQGAQALDNAYRISGNFEQWQNTVARYGVGNSRLAVSFATSFVGPLLALLGEEGGGINLRGPSSIGKSTALFAAASAWGAPSFVRQWRATANGLGGLCVQHNETFLPLDELAQLDQRDASVAAYLLSNGTGKARAGQSGSLRSSASWRVMFLSSGEISLSDLAGRDSRGTKKSAAGQEVRILDCEADAGVGLGLFEKLHEAPNAELLARMIKEGAAKHFGHAGPAFVESIIANPEGVVREVKNDIDAFITKFLPNSADGQVARAARRFGLIAAAGEQATRLGILPWPEGETAAACGLLFRQWLSVRGGIGSAEDRDAIAKVRAFLEMHGNSRFESIEADEDSPRIINRAGFWRHGENGREYLFLAETWKAEVCAGLDASRVTKVLAANGMLRKDSAGKNSITITLPAGIGKTRCYVVNSTIFAGDADG